MTIEFTVPHLRIESANTLMNKHWAARKAVKDAQRDLVYWAYRQSLADGALPGSATAARWMLYVAKPLTITLTRIAPRELDGHDNLRLGFKVTVDMLTELIGAKSDADPRLTWRYAQERGKPKEYSVRICIESSDVIVPEDQIPF